MRILSIWIACAALAAAQAQPAGRGGGGRGGRGNAGIPNFSVLTTAWPDGGMIPLRYSQAGPEISPAIQWSTPPAGTASFVVIFYDADSAAQNSTDRDPAMDAVEHSGVGYGRGARAAGRIRTGGRDAADQRQRIALSGSRSAGVGSGAPLHSRSLCGGQDARRQSESAGSAGTESECAGDPDVSAAGDRGTRAGSRGVRRIVPSSGVTRSYE